MNCGMNENIYMTTNDQNEQSRINSDKTCLKVDVEIGEILINFELPTPTSKIYDGSMKNSYKCDPDFYPCTFRKRVHNESLQMSLEDLKVEIDHKLNQFSIKTIVGKPCKSNF